MTARAESPPGAPAWILLDGQGRVRRRLSPSGGLVHQNRLRRRDLRRPCETMNQDDEQLHLLSVFHYVLAGICSLFSLFP